MGRSGNPAKRAAQKKVENKNSPQVENSGAVANFEPAEQPVSRRITNKEHFDRLMGASFSRPSVAKDRPVDEEGIPFISNAELSTFYGVHPDTVKKWTHTREIPHYVERKGLGRDTRGASGDVSSLDRGTNTWHKLSEIVDFLKDKGPAYLSHAAKAEGILKNARKDIRSRKAAGETVPTLHDNPDHPTLPERLIRFSGGRQVTENLTPAPEGRADAFVGNTSNISDALASGSGKIVGPKRRRRRA